jgi:hypothetical protein
LVTTSLRFAARIEVRQSGNWFQAISFSRKFTTRHHGRTLSNLATTFGQMDDGGWRRASQSLPKLHRWKSTILSSRQACS